jgi:hypothetical protein
MYDSKLFFGMELGPLDEIIYKLLCYYPLNNEHLKHLTMIDIVSWINTKLPDGVWLEVHYPKYTCDPSEMRAHLSLIDDSHEITLKKMKKYLRKANYIGYGYVLGQLNIKYKNPKFYTKYYDYS